MANPSETVERRALLPVEVRQDDGVIKVSGYAARFGEEAVIAGQFREVIQPGAFARAMSRDDVMFLLNHDDLPLARMGAGTLRLSEDRNGLRIEADLSADDPDAVRLAAKLRNKSVQEMSFAFRLSEDGQDWNFDEEDKLPLRTIKEVAELIEVSAVGRGAYSTTSIGLRSLEKARAEREEQEAKADEARAEEEKRRAFELRKLRERLARIPDLKQRESALETARRRIGL